MRHNKPIRHYLATFCTMLVLSGIVGISMSATGCGGSGKGTTTGGPVPPPPDDGSGNPPPPPPGSGDQYVNLKFWKEGVNLNHQDSDEVCVLGGLTGSKKVKLAPQGDGSYTGSFKNKANTNVAAQFFDGPSCNNEVPIDSPNDGMSRLEANGVHVAWLQPGTLLRLFYLDGSGTVSAPQGQYDTAAHQELVHCNIHLTYQGPTRPEDRDPMRIGGSVVRWSESTQMDGMGGAEYEYDTLCKVGTDDVRRIFFREQAPGVGADQQIGRFTGLDKPREQTTKVNGCDVSKSVQAHIVFGFASGDDTPRDMNGNKICN